MKVLLLFYLVISITIFGQETKIANQDLSVFFPRPKIDKRIELLSIVFRLAGNREYNSEDFKVYTQDIHKYFDKFKDHPVISFASKLRMEKGVSYDAVMKMAFHIGQPPLFAPKVKFNDDIPERRWGKDNAMKFIELLQDFYKVTDFDKFYNEHAEIYTIAEEKFLPVGRKLGLVRCIDAKEEPDLNAIRAYLKLHGNRPPSGVIVTPGQPTFSYSTLKKGTTDEQIEQSEAEAITFLSE